MRVTGIIVRFLSLLDVALCLLGVLMLWLVATQYRVGNRPVAITALNLEGLPTKFILLYGGTHRDREGRVYTLEYGKKDDWKLGPEVKARAQIERIAEKLPGKGKDARVMILLSNRGFDRSWTR